MEENRKEAERKFIHEKIRPRKNYRKILLLAGASLGLALIFGIAAGVTIQISQNMLGKNEDPRPQTIIIERDDAETSKDDAGPEAETKDEPSAGEDGKEPEDKELQDSDIRSVFMDTEASFVTLTVLKNGGTDWFDTQITSEKTGCGVCIAASDELLYFLTDGSGIGPEDRVFVRFSETEAEASLSGQDFLTGLAVYTLQKDLVPEEESIAPAELGNSFSVGFLDTVYLIGAPMGYPVAADDGIVTYVGENADIVDGYEQRFFTDMNRVPGSFACVINEDRMLVGIVSDGSCRESQTAAAAWGISPLKYLLEDMCSGVQTAYLGVLCRLNTEEDAAENGIPAGLYVREVVQDSPAYLAGIQAGDCIQTVNQKKVTDSHVLQLRLDDLSPDSPVRIEIARRGQAGYENMSLDVILGGR